MPPYIDRLVDHYFKWNTKITIDWEMVSTEKHLTFPGHRFVKAVICKRRYQWINIDLLCKLFQNLRTIELKNGYVDKITMCKDTIDDIHAFLMISCATINEIRIQCNNKGIPIEQIINDNAQRFNNIGFDLSFKMLDWLHITRKTPRIQRKIRRIQHSSSLPILMLATTNVNYRFPIITVSEGEKFVTIIWCNDKG